MGNLECFNRSKKSTQPSGIIYDQFKYDLSVMSSMVLKNKVAPFHTPLDEKQVKKKSKKMRVELFEECPICFYNFFGGLNFCASCKQRLCSECYFSVRHPNDEESECPFCNISPFNVEYKGLLSEQEIKEKKDEEKKVKKLEAKVRENELKRDHERELVKEEKKKKEEEMNNFIEEQKKIYEMFCKNKPKKKEKASKEDKEEMKKISSKYSEYIPRGSKKIQNVQKLEEMMMEEAIRASLKQNSGALLEEFSQVVNASIVNPSLFYDKPAAKEPDISDNNINGNAKTQNVNVDMKERKSDGMSNETNKNENILENDNQKEDVTSIPIDEENNDMSNETNKNENILENDYQKDEITSMPIDEEIESEIKNEEMVEKENFEENAEKDQSDDDDDEEEDETHKRIQSLDEFNSEMEGKLMFDQGRENIDKSVNEDKEWLDENKNENEVEEIEVDNFSKSNESELEREKKIKIINSKNGILLRSRQDSMTQAIEKIEEEISHIDLNDDINEDDVKNNDGKKPINIETLKNEVDLEVNDISINISNDVKYDQKKRGKKIIHLRRVNNSTPGGPGDDGDDKKEVNIAMTFLNRLKHIDNNSEKPDAYIVDGKELSENDLEYVFDETQKKPVSFQFKIEELYEENDNELEKGKDDNEKNEMKTMTKEDVYEIFKNRPLKKTISLDSISDLSEDENEPEIEEKLDEIGTKMKIDFN